MAASVRDLQVGTADGLALTASVHEPAGSDGMPVLLLHGLSQQRRFWDPVVTRLRARPVATLDQRGHGESDTPLEADYSLDACGRDAIAVLEALGWSRAVIVGHSWGASVALRAAALAPARAAAVALIDGGLWSPAALGDRAQVRRQLTPPALGVPEDTLWSMVRQGDLGASWSDEVQAALAPTFTTDDEGLMRTRIGVERHLRVLDGLLDAVPAGDLEACELAGTPVWAAVCAPGGLPDPGDDGGPWQAARKDAVDAAARRSNLLVHRWSGAVHDVPLQWPALVAGLIDSLVEEVAGAASGAGTAGPDGGTE
jgi:pimeloyl-ACP methyl ester carboxylesterase